jgi:hypothetical protein
VRRQPAAPVIPFLLAAARPISPRHRLSSLLVEPIQLPGSISQEGLISAFVERRQDGTQDKPRKALMKGHLIIPSAALVLLAAGGLSVSPARGQTPTDGASAAPPPAPSTSEPAGQGESGEREPSVGYIDPATPANRIRFRYDANYDDRRPTRADFLYPGIGGPPRPEIKVDYQEISAYFEAALAPTFSVFIESPTRFIHPEINADHSGFSDINAGFKWAFWCERDLVASFQFRTYAPTGDANLALGTNHFSLEPGLLVHQQLTSCLALDSELRLWIPVDASTFAGDVVRYGVGVSYDVYRSEGFRVTPVAEFVGWTVLDGKERVVFSPSHVVVQDADGDTIVNVKLGLRLGLGDRADIYGGYGRALTGDTWYKDTARLEFRLFF